MGHKLFLSVDEVRLQLECPFHASTNLLKQVNISEKLLLLVEVAARFKVQRPSYNALTWNRMDEVLSIPRNLWLSTVYKIISDCRLKDAQTEARIIGVPLEKVWPLSNNLEVVSSPNQITDGDFRLTINSFFSIELAVGSRFKANRTSAGLITVALTITSIATETKLLGSILNRLRINLNPEIALRMRRERVKLWREFRDESLTNIPVHRFSVAMIDNINHSTKYAVLGVAKSSTDMNGTATMVALAPQRTQTAYGVRIASVCNLHPSGGREASMHIAQNEATDLSDNLRSIARLNTHPGNFYMNPSPIIAT